MSWVTHIAFAAWYKYWMILLVHEIENDLVGALNNEWYSCAMCHGVNEWYSYAWCNDINIEWYSCAWLMLWLCLVQRYKYWMI